MAQEFVSISEFARRLGVGRQSVQYAIKRGRLSVIEHEGKKVIDVEAGLAQWEATLNKTASTKGKKAKGSKKKKVAKKKVKKQKAEPAPKWTPPPKVDQDGDITTAEAERREKLWRSELNKLKYEKEAGNLVEKSEVQRRAFECARKTRDAIMSVPARTAHELAAEIDPHKVELMLRKYLENALSKLINGEDQNGET